MSEVISHSARNCTNRRPTYPPTYPAFIMTDAASSTPSSSPFADPHSTYAALSFHKSNVLRLISFPEDVAAGLQPVILASWPDGLESAGPFGDAYEYKVKGSPFGYFRDQHHVGGVRLVRDVLAFLHGCSWELVAPMLCSRRYTAKDTLIFRQAAPDGLAPPPPPPLDWLVLVPTGSSKLRVVYDANAMRLWGGDADYDHLGVLIPALRSSLERLDYFEKGIWNQDSFAFELKGKPWRSRGEESIKVRLMVMRLLETMETHGWRLHATMAQRTGSDEERIPDTWYFVREREGTGKADTESLT